MMSMNTSDLFMGFWEKIMTNSISTICLIVCEIGTPACEL